ncbi:MAG: hypothetical protein NC123_05095 [Butyrivibrio sp.]|nr:hypothetical protein [Butyrivibrio sp.]
MKRWMGDYMKGGLGYTDMHSHVLPGLDDGAVNIRQSLNMLRIAREEGIETIYATPHFMPGKGCPDRDTILESLDGLKEAAGKEGLAVNLKYGAEYYFRQEVLRLLETDRAVPLEGTDCILTEFDPWEEERYIRRALCDILDRGYVPVAAHVERYGALMKKDFGFIREMRSLGVLIQINTGSVTGVFGGRAKHDTRALLKRELVDLLGTDAHSDRKRAPRIKSCADYLYRKLEREYAEHLLYGRALCSQHDI